MRYCDAFDKALNAKDNCKIIGCAEFYITLYWKGLGYERRLS